MRFSDTVLGGGIASTSLHRAQSPMPGDAALKLPLYFLGTALLERVRAAAQGQQCDCERKQKGLHLLILGSADFIARRLPVDTLNSEMVILSGAQRSRRVPRRYRKVMQPDSSTSLGMTV